MANKKDSWECDDCGELYSTEEEANSCCETKVETRGDPICRIH